MKSILKSALLGLLISSQAFAGLPPTTAKGQTDASGKVTFNLQVPESQATRINGTTALLETGNQNKLKNPGFEAATLSDWTSTGGIFAKDVATGDVCTGKASGAWDASAATQHLTSAAVTINAGDGLSGQNGVVSCRFKCDVASTCTHTLGAWNGSADLTTPVSITSSNTGYVRTSVNFVMPASGTVALRVNSVASNEPNLLIDDCYLGLADGFNLAPSANISDWISFTPATIGAGWGTPTSQDFSYHRLGDSIQFKVSFVAGTVAGSSGRIQFPSSLAIDAGKFPATFNNLGTVALNVAHSAGPIFVNATVIGGVSYLVFGDQTVSGGLADSNISTLHITTGDTVSFVTEPIAVTGWSALSAQVINGSIISNSASALRHEYALVNNNGSVCAVNADSSPGWLTVVRSGTGICTGTLINTPVIRPICTVSPEGGMGKIAGWGAAPTSTTLDLRTSSTTNPSGEDNIQVNIQCDWKR